MASLGAALALTALAPTAGAQAPKRRAANAQIAAAGAAFVEGVGGVSRNESAFIQTVVTNGCEIGISSKRVEKADSLEELHLFDAGILTAHHAMRIDATTGAIMFAFPTVGGIASVTRSQRRVVGGAAGGGSVTTVPPERVDNVLMLVANTSRQPEVVVLLQAWSGLVNACGGDATPAP